MKTMNMLVEQNMECPSCREYDICHTDCICPTCTRPTSDKGLNEIIKQWAFFAPVMAALNNDDVEWGWTTEMQLGEVKHGLEIHCDEGWCEVIKRGDKYLVVYFAETAARTMDSPAVFDEYDTLLVEGNAAAVADFVSSYLEFDRRCV